MQRSQTGRVRERDEKESGRRGVGGRRGGGGAKASGVVSFNWASGSGTRSDNIKGQIYIKNCWENV